MSTNKPLNCAIPRFGRKRSGFRRITVKLKTPTRDGDAEIHLLTNLFRPWRVSALKVAALYRKRWTLEQAFYELTIYLRCELNTLGYPKAAAVRFRCGRLQLQPACGCQRRLWCGVHGEEKTETEVSNFFPRQRSQERPRGNDDRLAPDDVEDLLKDEPGGVGRRLTFSSGPEQPILAMVSETSARS